MYPGTLLAAALLAAPAILTRGTLAADPPVREWGREALAMIQQDLWLPARGLYAEEGDLGKPAPERPAWNWGSGVQLSALAAAAAREDGRYERQMRSYLVGLRAYWTDWHGLQGFAVAPNPQSVDRYYDDNEWMGLALLDAYAATRDPQLLDWAEKTYAFVMSGEDDKLGGGIYWRELERKSKNTCSNAPATVLALRLHQITRNPAYLEAARRLYTWTNSHLQDADGLYWDNIELGGKVGDYKWSYNTGLMLRANVLFYASTRDKRYLVEAKRLGKAAVQRWVDPATGAIRDEGPFAHLLAEALLALHAQDRRGPWRGLVLSALAFVHDHVRDTNGHYAKAWGRAADAPVARFSLIDQASVARAYWMASSARWP